MMKNSSTRTLYLVYILVLVILGLGLNILLASTSFQAKMLHGDPYFYFKKQAFFALLGIVALLVFSQIPYRIWQSGAWWFYGLSIIFLLLVFIPSIGREAGGARRWIEIAGISAQPSDIVKFTTVLVIARLYSLRHEDENRERLRHILAVGVILVPVFLVYKEPDFGTAMHIIFASAGLLIIAGFPSLWLLAGSLLMIPVVYFSVIQVPYRWNRVKAFLDPYEHRFEGAYQLIASFKSFLSGGLWGQGLGEGLRRHNLQARHTDFIFAIVAEDLGLIGVVLVMALYFGLAVYAIMFLKNIEDGFGQYLGVGIIVLFNTQALLNIAVTMGLIPTTGINLPLFSYGGTSLLSYMAMMGILMNIIKENGNTNAKNG